MVVNNELGEIEELKQVQPRKEYDTLGVFIAPNGSQTYQLRKMKKKATSCEYNIQTGHLPEHETWKCLSSTIIKLDYPLPAPNLSKKECGELTKIIKDAGLPHY